MYCRKCGKVIPGDSKFCSFCGEEIEGKEYRYEKDPEFVWNVSDYPTGEIRKTEDVNFDWNGLNQAETPTDIKDMKLADLQEDIIEDPEELFESIKKDTEAIQDADFEKKIDQFYTFNRKNEEFQALLDKEYEKLSETAAFRIKQKSFHLEGNAEEDLLKEETPKEDFSESLERDTLVFKNEGLKKFDTQEFFKDLQEIDEEKFSGVEVGGEETKVLGGVQAEAEKEEFIPAFMREANEKEEVDKAAISAEDAKDAEDEASEEGKKFGVGFLRNLRKEQEKEEAERLRLEEEERQRREAEEKLKAIEAERLAEEQRKFEEEKREAEARMNKGIETIVDEERLPDFDWEKKKALDALWGTIPLEAGFFDAVKEEHTAKDEDDTAGQNKVRQAVEPVETMEIPPMIQPEPAAQTETQEINVVLDETEDVASALDIDFGETDQEQFKHKLDEIFDASEDEEEEEKKHGFLKFLITLVLIILAVEVGILAVRIWFPDSGAALFIDQNLSFLTEWVMNLVFK